MANFNLNKVILGGRITADVELKQTPSGVPVATFSIAVNRKYSKNGETDFFNVKAWRATAEFVSKYFGKGSSICVIGSIENRSWTDAQGQKRYATDIIADEVQFVDGKNDAQGEGASSPGNYIPDAYKADAEPNYEVIDDGTDDLPF